MAFTFGFYDSANHDRRYNAVQMAMIFDGLISDGVYATVGKCFVVKESAEENTVIVQPGRAWFDHTWNYNDADLPIQAPQSEIILDRWDALVIDINANENHRLNDIIWVKGIPSSNPAKPELINTLEHHQHPLCYVFRKANNETITDSDIENMVGKAECPFVTGLLDTISIDDLLLQWKDQWAQFIITYEKSAQDWIAQEKADFQKFYAEFKTQMNAFEQASGKDFTDWFSSIQDILDQNTAGNLLNLINEIDEREFLHYYGMVNATTKIDKTTGTITTTTADGVSTTRFQTDDSGNKTITTTLVLNGGNFDYVKTTLIVKETASTHIETSYLRRPK